MRLCSLLEPLNSGEQQDGFLHCAQHSSGSKLKSEPDTPAQAHAHDTHTKMPQVVSPLIRGIQLQNCILVLGPEQCVCQAEDAGGLSCSWRSLHDSSHEKGLLVGTLGPKLSWLMFNSDAHLHMRCVAFEQSAGTGSWIVKRTGNVILDWKTFGVPFQSDDMQASHKCHSFQEKRTM